MRKMHFVLMWICLALLWPTLELVSSRRCAAQPAEPEVAPAEPVKLPPGGLTIPKEMKQVKERFDKDNDGILSQEEFDAMPPQLQKRVQDAVAPKPADPVELPPFKLPPEGIVLPDDLTKVRERFDKNQDGKLTQDELDAMPPAIRDKVESNFRQLQSKSDAEKNEAPDSTSGNQNVAGTDKSDSKSETAQDPKADGTSHAAENGNSGSTMWIVISVIAGVVLIVGVVVLMTRRRDQPVA